MSQESPPPRWSQDESIAFEAARDGITHVIAIHSAQIDAEACKPDPDAALVASLEAEISRLHVQRAALHVHDAAEIARVRSTCGAVVRAWLDRSRGSHEDLEALLQDDFEFLEPTDAQRAAMAAIGARPGAVGMDAHDRLVRVRADGSLEVLEGPPDAAGPTAHSLDGAG